MLCPRPHTNVTHLRTTAVKNSGPRGHALLSSHTGCPPPKRLHPGLGGTAPFSPRHLGPTGSLDQRGNRMPHWVLSSAGLSTGAGPGLEQRGAAAVLVRSLHSD